MNRNNKIILSILACVLALAIIGLLVLVVYNRRSHNDIANPTVIMENENNKLTGKGQSESTQQTYPNGDYLNEKYGIVYKIFSGFDSENFLKENFPGAFESIGYENFPGSLKSKKSKNDQLKIKWNEFIHRKKEEKGDFNDREDFYYFLSDTSKIDVIQSKEVAFKSYENIDGNKYELKDGVLLDSKSVFIPVNSKPFKLSDKIGKYDKQTPKTLHAEPGIRDKSVFLKGSYDYLKAEVENTIDKLNLKLEVEENLKIGEDNYKLVGWYDFNEPLKVFIKTQKDGWVSIVPDEVSKIDFEKMKDDMENLGFLGATLLYEKKSSNKK